MQHHHHTVRASVSAVDNLTAVVTTINTPLPVRIDEDTLIACLTGKMSAAQWRVHVQALFDEVDISTIHALVIDGFVTFAQLSKAIDDWQVMESDNERWVREMAAFELGNPDAEGVTGAR